MKKFLLLIASIVMIFTMASFAYAGEYDFVPISALPGGEPTLIAANPTSAIRVQNDGEYIDFVDVNPQIINDRTMVPFRKIFNSLGVTDENIKWTPETRTVNAKKDNVEIELQIDNNVAKKIVSGETTNITLDSAPVIRDGRTLVPVRFIAESMDRKVSWDAEKRVVVIADVKGMMADLRASIPNYFELVDAQKGVPNTYNATMKVTGKVDYKNSENKSDNTNINIEGDIVVAKSNNAISLDMNCKLTGKGSAYEVIKSNKLTSINIKGIITEDKMYVYSPLFEKNTSGKWIVSDLDDTKSFSSLFEGANLDLKETIEKYLNEVEFDANTYSLLKTTFDALKKVLTDDNVSVKGTSTKKYEIKIDALKLLKEFAKNEELKDLSLKNCLATITGTIENGYAIKNGIKLNVKLVKENETIAIDIDADAKFSNINESVSIKIPTGDQVVTAE